MSEEPLGAALGSRNTEVLGGGEGAVGNPKWGHSGVPSPRPLPTPLLPTLQETQALEHQPPQLTPCLATTLRAPGLLLAPATH